MGALHISVKGEDLLLLPTKAIYILRSKVLVVADLHLGKSRHFRKNGLAVPAGSGMATIHALESLIVQYRPHYVLFLGDLFHSEINEDWYQFHNFILGIKSTDFILIRGNHDLFPDSFYERSGLAVVEKLELHHFLMTHEPVEQPGGLKYNLCGHLHPGFVVRGKGKQFLRLPCFAFDESTGFLPAFGKFTGLAVIEKLKGKRIFITSGSEVMEV